MAGPNTVLRLVGAVLSIVVIIFVSWVGVILYEPVAAALGSPPASLGWNTPDYLFFMGLGLVGLVLTIFFWLVLAPIKSDVRQERRRV